MLNVLVKVFLKLCVFFFVVILKGESLERIFVLFFFNVFYWVIFVIIFVLGSGVYKFIIELLI